MGPADGAVGTDEKVTNRPQGGRSITATVRDLLPFRAVVAPWLVSRVLSLTVLLAAMNDPAGGSRLQQLAFKWDGSFYVVIAHAGYGPVDVAFPRWPFFPGLPLVIRGLSHVWSNDAGILVVNQLVFLLALAGLHRLARRHGGTRVALLAVWALALFPASFVFSMAYPSSIFLAASTWAFVCVEERHDLLAGLLAASAAIVRPNGAVVAVSLVVAVWSVRRAILVATPAVCVLLGWLWYCYDRTGDALVFLTTKARWEEITFLGLFRGEAKLTVLPHALLALAALVVVIVQRRRMPAAWLALTALSLLPSLLTGMVGLARYANECFPPFVAAGQVLERWPVRLVVLGYVLSACTLVVFAWVVGRHSLVP